MAANPSTCLSFATISSALCLLITDPFFKESHCHRSRHSLLLVTSRFQHPSDDRFSGNWCAPRRWRRRASPQRIIKALPRIFIGSESHAYAARLKNTPSLAIGSLDASVAVRATQGHIDN
ncbi:MAG TPA: hypothetical protein VK678_20760, partial [Bradyrhizobium sp.]|nr:hypothetical protein [Bradyrhizobium sp.]